MSKMLRVALAIAVAAAGTVGPPAVMSLIERSQGTDLSLIDAAAVIALGLPLLLVYLAEIGVCLYVSAYLVGIDYPRVRGVLQLVLSVGLCGPGALLMYLSFRSGTIGAGILGIPLVAAGYINGAHGMSLVRTPGNNEVPTDVGP